MRAATHELPNADVLVSHTYNHMQGNPVHKPLQIDASRGCIYCGPFGVPEVSLSRFLDDLHDATKTVAFGKQMVRELISLLVLMHAL